MNKVVYIAGPITSVENYKEPFGKAAKEIKAMGFIPITDRSFPARAMNAW